MFGGGGDILGDGSDLLGDGVDFLGDGGDLHGTGGDLLGDGVDLLVDGVNLLVDGVNLLGDGVDLLADGGDLLGDGGNPRTIAGRGHQRQLLHRNVQGQWKFKSMTNQLKDRLERFHVWEGCEVKRQGQNCGKNILKLVYQKPSGIKYTLRVRMFPDLTILNYSQVMIKECSHSYSYLWPLAMLYNCTQSSNSKFFSE